MLHTIKQSYLLSGLVSNVKGLLISGLYLGDLYSSDLSYLAYLIHHGLSVQKSQHAC